jgi:hypothetical protein
VGNPPEQVKKFYLDAVEKMAYNITIVEVGIAAPILALWAEANPRTLNRSMHSQVQRSQPECCETFPLLTGRLQPSGAYGVTDRDHASYGSRFFVSRAWAEFPRPHNCNQNGSRFVLFLSRIALSSPDFFGIVVRTIAYVSGMFYVTSYWNEGFPNGRVVWADVFARLRCRMSHSRAGVWLSPISVWFSTGREDLRSMILNPLGARRAERAWQSYSR